LVTQIALDISDFVLGIPVLPTVGVIIAVLVLIFVTFGVLSRDPGISETVLLPLPLLGPIWRRNLLARWCDAVALGVDAGMDLPAAIALADDAIASPGLHADGQAIIAAVSNGRPISEAAVGKILPPIVPAAMELGVAQAQLAQNLHALSISYQQQSETRLATLQAVLTPIVLLILGAFLGALLLALFAPLITMIAVL